MLARVVIENGVKKIVPLTADCGSGNPVGTVIAVYSNKVPNGYLPCNGVAFDTAQFPVLYALLQDDHTPDLRECTLKGIGESGRTVGAHVKAGGLAVGEFIDDRIQTNADDTSIVIKADQYSLGEGKVKITAGDNIPAGSAQTIIRGGATTEVKAVGVNWCIKATSGINENQADNVLSALTPVNTVVSGDMHSVTSNAVSNELSATMRAIDTYFTRFFTANTTVHIKDFVNKVVEVLGRGYKYITFGWLNANQGYITDGNTSVLMNGNFIMGYFRPITDSVTFVYSHFITCDINSNKVFHVWIRRDSIEITESIDVLN